MPILAKIFDIQTFTLMKFAHDLVAKNALRRAFTIVEILIVAVLIGIIAAAAVPAVSQYRAAKARTAMMNDGQRLGNAAQTYFAETLERTVVVKYNPASGTVSAPAAFRMLDGNKIAPEYIVPDNEIKITFDTKESFTLRHPRGGEYTFSDKGELSRSSD